MEVKGSAIATIQGFVKNKYGGRFQEWLDSLPSESKKIYSGRIIPGLWYSVYDTVVVPTEKVIELFYGGNEHGSRELGRYNAETNLKGLYKVFVRIATPSFLIARVSNIFSTFYRPAKVEAEKLDNNSAVLRILEFPEPNYLCELGIAGFTERALEICGCKGLTVNIVKSLAKGDTVTEILATWT